MQGGYEILVSDSEKGLAAEKGNMWSAKVKGSDRSLHIPYSGTELEPGKRYWWKVRIFDEKNKPSPWSIPATFGIGLLSGEDWEGARWIALEVMPEAERIVPGLEFKKLQTLGDRKPGVNKLPQFRKETSIDKPVKKAVAYVSGIGHFEFFINGKKVGDNFMDPAWSDYDKQIYYVPFDVTDELEQGSNVLGVMLGNGFISIPRERYFKALVSYCYPMMRMKLVVEYADGSRSVTVSDRTWKATESPITYSSIYGGEDYDATRYHRGWMEPGYDDTSWQAPLFPVQKAQLISQIGMPVCVMQEFPPVRHRKTAHGKWLYDLGQNFSGIIRVTVKGHKDDQIRFHAAELFDTKADSITEHGGYRGEFRFTYTASSDRSETWQPQFTYTGFRYVLVTGAIPEGEENPDGLPVIENITGLHIRNSTPQTGSFECSNDLFNKVHALINWGMKSNIMSYLTDCPHREKLPWMEQLHLMFGSLQQNFDMYKLYEKMMEDMALAQWDDGLIPDTCPMFVTLPGGFVDSPEWGSAFILVPWKVYEYYGDASLFTRYYDSMKRYLDYLGTKADDYILSHGLGDWCDLGPKYPGFAQLTSLEATATPIYYMDAFTMAKIAALLGKTDDAMEFEALAEAIKISYNEKFFHADGHYYDRNSQTANAMPLYAGMVEPRCRQAVLDNIVKDIRSRGDALTGGDVGYDYILRALEEGGRSDVIYDMNSSYSVYGYGYMLAQGATALVESWQALAAKSHNHFMLGHLQEWFYTHVGGIRNGDSGTAYKTIVVKPEPVGNLTWAKTGFVSPHGLIRSEWRFGNGGFCMDVEIPANTTAMVWVPASEQDMISESGVDASRSESLEFAGYNDGYKIYRVGSGIYRFRTTTNALR